MLSKSGKQEAGIQQMQRRRWPCSDSLAGVNVCQKGAVALTVPGRKIKYLKGRQRDSNMVNKMLVSQGNMQKEKRNACTLYNQPSVLSVLGNNRHPIPINTSVLRTAGQFCYEFFQRGGVHS